MLRTQLRRREWLAAGTAIVAGGAASRAEAGTGTSPGRQGAAHAGATTPSPTGTLPAGAEYQHDPRPEAVDRRGDRDRREGRISRDGALGRRAGAVCGVGRLARGPRQAIPRRGDLRRERDRLLRVDRRRSGTGGARAWRRPGGAWSWCDGSAGNGWPPRRSGRPIARCPTCSIVAERYRALLELGDQIGVVPQVEVWGFSRTLGRLGEAALVAMEARHPSACILPDVYHLYRGGSGLGGIKLLVAARDPRLPHQRLPGRSAPREADRRRPGLSRRRHRAAQGTPPGPLGRAASTSCCRSSCSTGSTGPRIR